MEVHDLKHKSEQWAEFMALFHFLESIGATPFIVGGFVRDLFLNKFPNDLDVEVFGIDINTLQKYMSIWAKKIGGHSKITGNQFPVCFVHTPTFEIEIALARTETSTALGKDHYEVNTKLDIKDTKLAAGRRDFTFNAMMLNPFNGEVLDHFGGLKDLRDRMIRPCTPSFKDEPLRVKRAMRFIATLGLTPTQLLIVYSKEVVGECKNISKERFCKEFTKLAKFGTVPSKGLEFLRIVGWTKEFPELQNMIDCPQDPRWHPEGDVWQHTLFVMDAAAKISIREKLDSEDRMVLVLAALCHDIGKPATTIHNEDGSISSPAHASVGVPIAKTFLESIKMPTKIIKRVCELVKFHMVLSSNFNKKTIARLMGGLAKRSLKYNDIQMLKMMIESDLSGRPPRKLEESEGFVKLCTLIDELENQEEKVEPLINGDDLIARGLKPSKLFGELKEKYFDLQIEGNLNREQLIIMLDKEYNII